MKTKEAAGVAVRTVAVVGGAVAAVAAVAGALYAGTTGIVFEVKKSDWEHDKKSMALDVHRRQQAAYMAQNRYDKNAESFRELKAELGARCLSLIKPFEPGGELYENTSFGFAVNEITSSSSQACGDNSLQVSKELVHYQAAASSAYSSLHRKKVAHQELQRATAKERQPAGNLLDSSAEVALIIDGVTVVSLALAATAFHGMGG